MLLGIRKFLQPLILHVYLHLSLLPLLVIEPQINLIQSCLAFAPLHWQALFCHTYHSVIQPTTVTWSIINKEHTNSCFLSEIPRSVCLSAQAILKESHINRNIAKKTAVCLWFLMVFLIYNQCHQNFLLSYGVWNLSLNYFHHVMLKFKDLIHICSNSQLTWLYHNDCPAI